MQQGARLLCYCYQARCARDPVRRAPVPGGVRRCLLRLCGRVSGVWGLGLASRPPNQAPVEFTCSSLEGHQG
eukprot:5082989-Lingulodinium_polyedra.AAC.1